MCSGCNTALVCENFFQVLNHPEYNSLRTAASLDSCGQPGILKHSCHNGRPHVFASLGSCVLNGPLKYGRWSVVNSMNDFQWFGTQLELLGEMRACKVVLLRPHLLELNRTQQHAYSRVWVAEPSGNEDTSDESEFVQVDALLLDQGQDQLLPHLSGALGKASVCTSSQGELSARCVNIGTALCVHGAVGVEGYGLLSVLLRIIQLVIHCGHSTTVWVTSERAFKAGAAGLLHTVSMETASAVRLALLDDQHAECALVRRAAVQRGSNNLMVCQRNAQQWVCQLSQTVVSQHIPEFAGSTIGGPAFITGGTGALGILVSCWLTTHGAKYTTLLSRSGTVAAARWQECCLLYTQSEISLCVDFCDMRENCDAISSLQRTNSSWSMVHAAGSLADAVSSLQNVSSLHP